MSPASSRKTRSGRKLPFEPYRPVPPKVGSISPAFYPTHASGTNFRLECFMYRDAVYRTEPSRNSIGSFCQSACELAGCLVYLRLSSEGLANFDARLRDRKSTRLNSSHGY